MHGFPAPASPAPSGFFGVLRSWLQARPSETWPSTELLASENGWATSHFPGSVRVLVVDDNPVNLMVMSASMESRGLVPLLAADGAEAVALAGELQFDLILMDLQMPVLDGLGATSAIRRFEAEHGRAAVPIVAYSSSTPGASVLTRHGLNGSLAKPCEDAELDACLQRWCPTYRPVGEVESAAMAKRWLPTGQSAGGSGASLG